MHNHVVSFANFLTKRRGPESQVPRERKHPVTVMARLYDAKFVRHWNDRVAAFCAGSGADEQNARVVTLHLMICFRAATMLVFANAFRHQMSKFQWMLERKNWNCTGECGWLGDSANAVVVIVFCSQLLIDKLISIALQKVETAFLKSKGS